MILTDKGKYDKALITVVSNSVTIPVIASSGAGAEYFSEIFNSTTISVAGIFHRKEVHSKRQTTSGSFVDTMSKMKFEMMANLTELEYKYQCQYLNLLYCSNIMQQL